MGFLSDLFGFGNKTPTQAEVEVSATGRLTTPPRPKAKFDWALPEDYDPIPPVRLQRWGEFDGRKAGPGGYGFAWPDGRLLHPGRLGVRRWKKVGIFYGTLAGGKFHLDALNDPGFGPGQPLRLVAEPDNPQSEKGTAIAIYNWAGDKRAGYVESEETATVRKLAADEDFRVIALTSRYHQEPPSGNEIVRTFFDWVMFRPGRIEGLDELPPHPPIAPPRHEGSNGKDEK